MAEVEATRGLWAKLTDFQPAELPALTVPFWKLTGPGAVLVGLSIGAGEIVVWPGIAAKYGASMVWAAALGVFLQLWINLEVGRWTVATGETVYTGYARIWRGFAPLFILLTILGWLAPGWARISGGALRALLVGPGGWGSDTFWTAVTFAGVAALLFGPKLVYRTVERTVSALVLIVVVGLVIVAAVVGRPEHWAELGRGLVNFGYRDPQMTIQAFFSAIVFAGAGGTANLFYTFYLRDKQIGMGVHVPKLLNPLRAREESAATTGYVFEDTPENAARFRHWMRYITQDTALFFWALNTFTIMLFIFGALAALHHHDPPIVPQSGSLIWDQAAILAQVWGPTGRTIFLLVGVATLFSTQLTLLDGVGRSLADIIHTNFRPAQRRPLSWWYGMIVVGWMAAGIAITYICEARQITELGFLFSTGFMGGIAMAIYVPLQLYANLRFLPRSARPGPLNLLCCGAAGLVYIGFALASIYWLLP